MTEVLRVDPVAPDPAAVARAAAVLRDGGLVGLPTETVYGLAAHALDRVAVRRVFTAKGRPSTDPLIVHVADADAARALAAEWPAAATTLAGACWPGPLTLVVPRAQVVPDEVTAGGPTVALRVPDHPVALAVLGAAGVPVAAPSANRFGRISPTSAADVVAELDGLVDLVLDAGPCAVGVESTVVALDGPVPRLLRPGGVTVVTLTELLGPIDAPRREVDDVDVAAAAPGRLLSHYSPATPAVLARSAADAESLCTALVAGGTDARPVVLPEDPATAAAALYRRLRDADAAGAAVLVLVPVGGDGLGRAVDDRLFRAAHGRVVGAADATAVAGLAAAGGGVPELRDLGTPDLH